MTQPTNSSYNLHPLSQIRTEPLWEGKYDEYGDRHEVDVAGCAMPMQKIYQRLNTTPEQLADFYEKWKIEKLALFGSVLRDDFRVDGRDPSDIDFLYLFVQGVRHSLFDVMHLSEELEGLLQRKVVGLDLKVSGEEQNVRTLMVFFLEQINQSESYA